MNLTVDRHGTRYDLAVRPADDGRGVYLAVYVSARSGFGGSNRVTRCQVPQDAETLAMIHGWHAGRVPSWALADWLDDRGCDAEAAAILRGTW